jgi:hypothetical protein
LDFNQRCKPIWEDTEQRGRILSEK